MAFGDFVKNLFGGRGDISIGEKREFEDFTHPLIATHSDWANSGVSVNEKSSLTISTFFACLSIIGNTLAYLPKQIRRRTAHGSEVDRGHDQHLLLSKYPNSWQTATTFWREFSDNKKVWGNGLAYMDRDITSGRPKAYYNLQPRLAKPVFVDGELFIYYDHELPNGIRLKDKSIPYSDVIHVPNFPGRTTMGGIWGASQLSVARDSMSLGKAGESAAASYFKNGGLFDKYLSTDLALNATQREIVKESLKAYQGAKNAGKMPLLDMGITVEGLNMPLGDFDLINSRKFSVEEIARFFTFSALHKIGHLDKMSFNNIYQMSIEFVQTTMIPETKPIEEELSRKILRPAEIAGDTHYINWEYKGLLQSDPAKRADLLRMFFESGMPPNQILKIEDQDPIGPEGDIGFVMTNRMPLKQSPEYWESMIAKNIGKK